MLDIHLLGPFSVEHDGRRLGPRDFGGVKPKQLLEVLLLERGHPVPKDRLADLLWGESLPRKISATLETYVSVLRRHLQPGSRTGTSAIITEPGAYRFDVSQANVDLDRFDHLVDRARRESARVMRRTLEEAVSMVRGELLEDEPYASWAEDHRHHYHERFLQAVNDAADAALAERDFLAGLEHAHRAIAIDRLSERGYRIAMLAAYALGRQGDALRAYERCRQVLADELGVEPLPETCVVLEAVQHHRNVDDLLPQAPVERVASVRSIHRRPTMLGRTTELNAVRAAVDSALGGAFTLVLVAGEAGIGKTHMLNEVADCVELPMGRASCSELERNLPYVPLAGALRELLQRFGVDPTSIPALAPILPEVSGPPVAQIHAFEAVVSVADSHAPFAILIDDLHFADEQTLAALAYLQRRCATAPIAIIASYCTDAIDSTHPLHRLVPALRVELGPLSTDDLAPLGRPELHELTGGHPLFVDAHLGDGSEDKLRQLVANRTRHIDALTHRILLAAAVLDEPIEAAPVARAIESDPGVVVDGLEALCARGILRIADDGFAFRQHAMRDVLAAELSPARRRVMRDRALDAYSIPRRNETDLVVDLRDAVSEVLSEQLRHRESADREHANRDNVRPLKSDDRTRHPSWTGGDDRTPA